MKFTQRDKRAIRLGAVALAVLVVFQLGQIVAGSWQSARTRLSAAETARQAIESRQRKQALQVPRLELLWGEAACEPLLPVREARLRFVKTVEEKLESGGLKVQDIRPQAGRKLRELDRTAVLRMQVQAQASLDQVTKALASLRRADQLVLVERLSLEPDAKRREKLAVNLTLATLARTEDER
ncbi:MAG: hypothetical protein ACOCTI_05845 [Phycisphaeraceae bacterium]